METGKSMGDGEALRPIASLMGKTEKALAKLSPGTWQHAMLARNLRALKAAAALMAGEAGAPRAFSGEELESALLALCDMAERSKKAQAKFSPGTSQFTLQRNRISALLTAMERVRQALAAGDAAGGQATPTDRR